MRKIKFKNIVLVSIFIIGSAASLAFAKVKVAPYFSLQYDMGVAVPSKGDWMFCGNLVNDLGIIVQPRDKHRFIAFYELKYTGPGLRQEEGDKFTDRTMDHIYVLRHQYKFDDEYTLKSQVDYMTEYRRTGANELWGTGLYDYNRYGFSETLERKFSKDLTGKVNVQWHYLDFPNYTDILAEFQAGNESVESSAGKQNQNVYQLGVGATYKELSGTIDYSMLVYTKQKVMTDDVQPDKTYYSGTLQKDDILTFGSSYKYKLLGFITTNPSVSFKFKNSNQNFQHFATVTSTVPVQYFGNYYSYTQFSMSLPVSFMLSKKWDFFCNTTFDFKNYLERPPRDPDGNYIGGRQENDLLMLSVGFTKHPNEVTTTTFFYNYQSQTSNMRFERYLPYNYAGHYIGVSFNYTY